MPRYTTGFLVKLDERERRQLDEEAARRGVSRAALIRRGLALVATQPPQSRQDGPAGILPAVKGYRDFDELAADLPEARRP